MKIVFLLIVIIIMACSYGIGYARGTANGRIIVQLELDPETLDSALYFHGITYCSFDGTFYFMREFQRCDLFSNSFRSWYILNCSSLTTLDVSNLEGRIK